MMLIVNRFTFYWLNGKREVLDGDNPNDALMRAGYNSGAVRALDFWAYGDCKDWVWNDEGKLWIDKDSH